MITARDRFLKPGGLLFPDSFTLRAAGTTAVAPNDLRHALGVERETALAARSARYGFDLNALNGQSRPVPRASDTAPRSPRYDPIYITAVPLATLCTHSVVFLRVNLATATAHSLLELAPANSNDTAANVSPRRTLRRINGSFEMRVRGGDAAESRVPTAIALWWSVAFTASPFVPQDTVCQADDTVRSIVELDTSPFSPATHWKQSLVVLPPRRGGQRGDVALRGTFSIGPVNADTWGRSFALELSTDEGEAPLRYKIPSAFDT